MVTRAARERLREVTVAKELTLVPLALAFWMTVFGGMPWNHLYAAPAVVNARDASLEATALDAVAREEIASIAYRKGYLIDPLVTEQLANDIFVYAVNECGSGNFGKPCHAQLTRNSISAVLENFLMDLATKVEYRNTKAIRARLDVKGTAFRPLSPAKVDYDLSVFVIPKEHAKHELTILRGGGDNVLGEAKSILIAISGRLTLKTCQSNNCKFVTANGVRLGRQSMPQSTQRTVQSVDTFVVGSDNYCRNRLDSATALQGNPFDSFGGLTYAQYVEWADSAQYDSNLPIDASAFLRQRYMRVDSLIDAALMCDPACQTALRELLASAIVAWRNACHLCRKSSLTTILIGGRLYVDWRLKKRVYEVRTPEDEDKIDLDVDNPSGAEYEAERSELIDMVWVRHNRLVDVSEDQRFKKTFCNIDQRISEEFKPLTNLLCESKELADTGKWLKAKVVFQLGSTSCGSTAVACGGPDANVELNAGIYRFTYNSFGTRGAIGGRGAILDVDLWQTLLHEVGHWFGVPHIDDVRGSIGTNLDVMARRLGTGQPCISTESLKMLNNAQRKSWRFRVGQDAALLPPTR